MSKGEVSELLKPRYKVIADFYQGQKDVKDNRIKVGDLFMNYMPQQNTVWRRVSNNKWEDVTIHHPEQYPHLFRKLFWYEEREASEMPEYVKNSKGEVVKVKTHFFSHSFEYFISEDSGDLRYYKYFQPATETEYLKTKQK